MLAEDDHADLRKTAKKADTLWAIHDVVAAMESEADPGEYTVAAIPSRGGTRGGGRSSGARSGGRPPTSNQQDQVSTSRSLAQQSAGLCFYHWSFGEKATKCRSPCSWQGN